jgi:hypothetical protein
MAIPERLESEAAEALAEYPKLTLDQCRLYTLMSDISEECYCAGWLSGNEYRLWSAMTDPKDDRAYGQGTITDDNVTDLQDLCERAGGWIYWHDDSWEPGLPQAHWGPRCMPIEEWRAHYATSEETAWYRNRSERLRRSTS